MNEIEKLEKKVKELKSLNDDFTYELKEVRDILTCIGYTDKDTYPEIILNAASSAGKVLDSKIEIFTRANDRIIIRN